MRALLRSWPRLLTAFALVAGLLAMHASSTEHPVNAAKAMAATMSPHLATDADSSDRSPSSPSAIHIVVLCAAIVATLSAAYRLRHRAVVPLRAARAGLHATLQRRSLVARAPSPRLLCVQRC